MVLRYLFCTVALRFEIPLIYLRPVHNCSHNPENLSVALVNCHNGFDVTTFATFLLQLVFSSNLLLPLQNCSHTCVCTWAVLRRPSHCVLSNVSSNCPYGLDLFDFSPVYRTERGRTCLRGCCLSRRKLRQLPVKSFPAPNLGFGLATFPSNSFNCNCDCLFFLLQCWCNTDCDVEKLISFCFYDIMVTGSRKKMSWNVC